MFYFIANKFILENFLFFKVSKIIVDYKLTMRHYTEGDKYRKMISNTHRRSAERLLRLACANGGVYIKVCVFILLRTILGYGSE